MIILRGGTVMPMHTDPFVGDVAFENGKIVELGAELIGGDAEIVDVKGKYILPGLVDPHSHIGLQETGSREVDHNEKGVPITPEMRAIDAIHPGDPSFEECRRLGITTVVTGPGSINLIGGTFAAIKTAGTTVKQICLRDSVAMKMALGENPKFRYSELGKEPHSRMGIAAMIRIALTKAYEYNAHKISGEIADVDLKMEALAGVLRGDIPMKIHCHRADDIETAIRIMNEFGIRYTLDHCSEGYLIPDTLHDALKDKCNGIIIGPIISFARKLECRYKLRTQYAAKLYEQKLPFAMCSDFPDSTPECLMLAAALGVAEGVPEDVALRSITIDAARVTGIADRVGSLAPGKDADIAVFSGNPLNCLNPCCATYIDGRQVYRRD